MSKELEIMCIYRSSTGREITYNDIKVHIDAMDEGDYEAINFWNTMGGLSITIDGYRTIYYSTGFYNIVKVVNLLLHSLCRLKNMDCSRFTSDENTQDELIVRITPDEIFKISFADQENVYLSWMPESGIKKIRGKHYFKDECFEIGIWIREAEIALEEYFEVLSTVIRLSNEDNRVIVMKKYLDVYKSIRG